MTNSYILITPGGWVDRVGVFTVEFVAIAILAAVWLLLFAAACALVRHIYRKLAEWFRENSTTP